MNSEGKNKDIKQTVKTQHIIVYDTWIGSHDLQNICPFNMPFFDYLFDMCRGNVFHIGNKK